MLNVAHVWAIFIYHDLHSSRPYVFFFTQTKPFKTVLATYINSPEKILTVESNNGDTEQVIKAVEKAGFEIESIN